MGLGLMGGVALFLVFFRLVLRTGEVGGRVEEEVKKVAEEKQGMDGPDQEGEMFTRPGKAV